MVINLAKIVAQRDQNQSKMVIYLCLTNKVTVVPLHGDLNIWQGDWSAVNGV